MKVIVILDQRREQLEQLWREDRRKFLAEYCRVVGRPANDPTRSLQAIIKQMIDCELGIHSDGTRKPR